DLVSWDPRGEAKSDGHRCRSDKEIQSGETLDATPDDRDEETAYFEDAADYGAGSENAAGKKQSHLSTTHNPPHKDVMPQFLADHNKHNIGHSKGTQNTRQKP
ncbi:alpha/beta hydrolase, partial [Streptomyces sp. SP17KL33]|nr:alpha/beta hydrolase [Streptomyces sp. SP17KL33]